MLLEPIKELDMTYKKLLKEAKKHIRTRIIDYKPASSIHIAGIMIIARYQTQLYVGLKMVHR